MCRRCRVVVAKGTGAEGRRREEARARVGALAPVKARGVGRVGRIDITLAGVRPRPGGGQQRPGRGLGPGHTRGSVRRRPRWAMAVVDLDGRGRFFAEVGHGGRRPRRRGAWPRSRRKPGQPTIAGVSLSSGPRRRIRPADTSLVARTPNLAFPNPIMLFVSQGRYAIESSSAAAPRGQSRHVVGEGERRLRLGGGPTADAAAMSLLGEASEGSGTGDPSACRSGGMNAVRFSWDPVRIGEAWEDVQCRLRRSKDASTRRRTRGGESSGMNNGLARMASFPPQARPSTREGISESDLQ